MRRMTYFVMALALVLGFTQCKKEQPTPQSQGVRITLTVDGGNSNSRVIVNPTGHTNPDYATVTFEDDDVIYVGYNNAYVGTLTYSNGTFDGTVNISEIVGDEHLHFYFLGGVGFEPTIDGNTATVVISDQTQKLPVISYRPSKEVFTATNTSYSAKLQNKISIMKFNVTTPSTAAICITGMNNKVTVDFTAPNGTDNGFAYDKEGVGLIEMPAKGANNETWAIVLPQEALTEGNEGTAFTYDGYKGNRPALEAIASNQYITTVDDDLDVSTFDINYMPLTFEAKTANATVTLKKQGSAPTVSLQKSTDGVTWTTYTVGTAISLDNVGDKVMLRASSTNTAFCIVQKPNTYYHYFYITDECYIYGNIMSLLKTDYATANSLGSTNYVFYYLFNGCDKLYNHDIKSLLLPATTLTEYCYASMFNGCTSLTKAPELPATTMKRYCYSHMFDGCSSLTEAPDLPAQTLDKGSYQFMFRGCTSLEETPELSATTLNQFCCRSMFEGCTSLITGPTLRATTLASGCYYDMFNGCTNLHSITCLTTTTISNRDYTADWVNGVSNSGTFTKASGINWPSGNDGIPSGWEVVDYSGK